MARRAQLGEFGYTRAKTVSSLPTDSDDLLERITGAPDPTLQIAPVSLRVMERTGRWRIHDRTHLELTLEYPVGRDERETEYVWEAYFFPPRSWRLEPRNYSKVDIHRDFNSYLRFAVSPSDLRKLATFPGRDIAPVLRDETKAPKELLLFGCRFRTSAHHARQQVLRCIEGRSESIVRVAAEQCSEHLSQALDAYRSVVELTNIAAIDAAAKRVDEDASCVFESVLSLISIRLTEAGYRDIAEPIAARALAEARRRHNQQDGPVSRNVDEFQLRKQSLKRFVSSVLWLRQEITQQIKWVREGLFAIAASIAMVFAVAAAFYHGTTDRIRTSELWTWILIVAIAYAGKDRLKASLQTLFSKWIAKRYPDRYWRLTTELDGSLVCKGEERSRFLEPQDLPDQVLEAHERDADHHLEPNALPISVLWHQKVFELHNQAIRDVDARFSSITEIFRLDVSRWITHTSDPKERIHLANLTTEKIQTALARRVYEMDIIYRVYQRDDEEHAKWSRSRVVLNRNGLRRVDSLERTDSIPLARNSAGNWPELS